MISRTFSISQRYSRRDWLLELGVLVRIDYADTMFNWRYVRLVKRDHAVYDCVDLNGKSP